MTKAAIIGAGKGGHALLEMFAGDPTVTILGVAGVNPWAPGLEIARRLNVPVATELRTLIAEPRLDLVTTLYGAHAAMYLMWNVMHELTKNEEQAQWALERTKVGHPTESQHVMARFAHFQDLERRYMPGTDERLKGSDGFSEAKTH